MREIKSHGGSAVADYNDVLNGDKVIATAIRAFGRVDVLINNAGILRDVSFKNMKDVDWDLIMNVHVIGAFRCVQAAWPYFQKQEYGRILNTASAAGLFGAFGQCNYSAAKLSQVGFTKSLAKDGKQSNIICNVIAPIAASRLTETVLTPEVLDKLRPEWVVPLVAVLVHESNTEENGSIFEVGAGHIAKFRWQRANGASFNELTAATILDNMNSISDFSNPTHPHEGVNAKELVKQKHFDTENGSSKPSLTGKVALVINGGTVEGRSICRSLAEHGVTVVVHDAISATSTVKEIEKSGGKAFGVKFDLKNAEDIVKAAIQQCGTIHFLVNHLAQSDDQQVSNLDASQFDGVLRLNLRSTFAITKAVWPFMIKQKFGKIVNFSSTSGVYGEKGKAAYSTTTAGILGFSRALALEGKKNNIFVNVVAKNTHHGAPRTDCASLTIALCSGDMPEPATGRLFEATGRWHGEVRWQRAGGHTFPLDTPLTPEAVQSEWKSITSFDDGRADNPSDQLSGQRRIMENVEKGQKKFSDKENQVLTKIKSVQEAKPNVVEHIYNDRDVILYSKLNFETWSILTNSHLRSWDRC